MLTGCVVLWDFVGTVVGMVVDSGVLGVSTGVFGVGDVGLLLSGAESFAAVELSCFSEPELDSVERVVSDGSLLNRFTYVSVHAPVKIG